MQTKILARRSSTVLLAIFSLIAAAGLIAQAPVPGATPVSSSQAPPSQIANGPQNQRTDSAVIRGRVIAAGTGAAVRRAQIHLLAAGATGSGVLTGTDDQGRYEYTGVAPGRYTITAEKAGYLKAAYGQRGTQDPGRVADLADAQVLERVDIALTGGGAITVRVTDDLGDPFGGARVDLQQYKFVNGAERFTTPFTGRTDESGLVRLSELPPGDYYILATPEPMRLVALGANDSGRILAATYHPGATSFADAVKTTIAAGRDASVDLRLAAVETVSVSGTIQTVTGEAISSSLSLLPLPVGSSTSRDIAPFGFDGRFTFTNVIPGRYTFGMAGPTQPRLYVARTPIEVTGDVTGVTLTATSGGTVRGRIVFDNVDSGTHPSNLSFDKFALRADPSWQGVMRPGAFHANEDGTFELQSVVGQSVLRARPEAPLPSGWFLKSVTLDGKDVTDTVLDFTPGTIAGLEVTFTQKQTELTGSALDARDAPVTDFVAVIFPEDHRQWTPQSRSIAAGRADQSGRFRVTGLPPGRYLAAAVPSLEMSEEHDVDLLERLEGRAMRFTLEEDEKQAIALRLVP